VPAVAAATRAEPRLPPDAPTGPTPHRTPPSRRDPGPEPRAAAAPQDPCPLDREQRARVAERLERCRRPAPVEPEPPSLADGLEAAERPGFEAVRRAFLARLDPADCGERILVEAIAACHFRRARLDAIEARLTRALLDGRPTDGLPSLPALARVRAALDKEQRKLERDLQRLYELRPEPIRYPGLNPVRLRWLAERIEEGRLRPWSPPAPAAPEEPAPEGAPVAPGEPATVSRQAAPEPTTGPRAGARGGGPSAGAGHPTPDPGPAACAAGPEAATPGRPSEAAAPDGDPGDGEAAHPPPEARERAAASGADGPARGPTEGEPPGRAAAAGRPVPASDGLGGYRRRSARRARRWSRA